MGNFINPFTDVGFKILFGSEFSKDMLIWFLNQLLKGEQEVTDVLFLDKENHGEYIHDKEIIFDLYCQTKEGTYIIAEMQNRKHPFFLDRTLSYVCRTISRQLERSLLAEKTIKSMPYGMDYQLSAVYGIFFMNFHEPALDKKFRTDVFLKDGETNRVIQGQLREVYLQFPFFTKELNDCNTLFDKWIYMFKNMHTWDRMPDALKDQVLQRLAHLAYRANLPYEERIAYERALDRYRVEQAVLYAEEMERKKAKEEMTQAQEEARKAREEAMMAQKEATKAKQEVTQAKQEAMKARLEGVKEVALQMKHNSMPLEMIIQCTGLSEDEINQLN